MLNNVDEEIMRWILELVEGCLMSFIAHCVMALLLEPNSNVPSSSGKMNSEFTILQVSIKSSYS
jgi:hypothetical protein